MASKIKKSIADLVSIDTETPHVDVPLRGLLSEFNCTHTNYSPTNNFIKKDGHIISLVFLQKNFNQYLDN